MNVTWRKLAALSMATGLLLLVLQPAAAVGLVLGVVLMPVLLFGLVLVPRSLWPAADLDHSCAAPVLGRGERFQRPPPISIL